jgi:hypothetical protein
MMQRINRSPSERESPCLAPCTWLFLAVAITPHLLMLLGQESMASMLACVCFPVSMGPLALVHTYLAVNRLGLLSHMAWISALLFSLTWFASLSWLWRRNKTIVLAFCALCLAIVGEWIWVGLLP